MRTHRMLNADGSHLRVGRIIDDVRDDEVGVRIAHHSMKVEVDVAPCISA
jgi:hypothetical protein